MTSVLGPIVFTVFLWWFSTGAILYLLGLPRGTYWSNLLIAGLTATGSFIALLEYAWAATPTAAYVAFVCSLLIWAALEIGFLTGLITGSRKTECPADATDWKRFTFATQSLIYHELSLLIAGICILVATWGAPNQVGFWTFLVLWVMRLSAKFNIFFGVPNVTEEFLPSHLHFLKSYFGRRSMNLFFPIAVTASTIVAAVLGTSAAASNITQFEQTAYLLLTTLLALAILEHWLMVLPLPAEALWSWSLSPNEEQAKYPLQARAESTHQLAQPQSVTGAAPITKEIEITDSLQKLRVGWVTK